MRKLKEKNKYKNKPKSTHTKNKQQKQKNLSHYYSKDTKALCTYARRLFYSSVSSEQKHNTTIISHFSSLYFIWICFKGEMEGKNEERQQSGKRKIESRQEFVFCFFFFLSLIKCGRVYRKPQKILIPLHQYKSTVHDHSALSSSFYSSCIQGRIGNCQLASRNSKQ